MTTKRDKNCSFTWGWTPHIIRGSFGPAESTS